MNAFLDASSVIDWGDPNVTQLAEKLFRSASGRTDFVRVAFEWVRDQIRHTGDFELDPVTSSASEVLRHQTGYCYAKSHLFVAICRAQGIPAGFGYQRLSIDGVGAPFCLHGFAAVDLGEHGWRRLDPRGNKPGIFTEFSAIKDSLAFEPTIAGERTFAEILPDPLDVVVDAMRQFPTRARFCNNLPDLPSLASLPTIGSHSPPSSVP